MGILHFVVMGVAGCGKSAVGTRVAARLGLPFIEGDAFHPPASVAKMQAGQPLTDADRHGWLAQLAGELAARPAGAVLSCSALKRAYREQLRAAVPALRFAYLALTPDTALARVQGRGAHFFPAGLVASQFDALEPPGNEPGVLTLDGDAPLDALVERIAAALAPQAAAAGG